MDVVLLRWPSEQHRREDPSLTGIPRLLLVDQHAPAPVIVECVEDWVRLPASDGDVDARCRALQHRVAGHATTRPVLDPNGVLRTGEGWVSLPPVEARLMTALLDRFGAVVSREQLFRAGWPAGAPGRNALDVHMLRVRRRIAPLRLVVTTVRSRGYLLDLGPEAAGPARRAARPTVDLGRHPV